LAPLVKLIVKVVFLPKDQVCVFVLFPDAEGERDVLIKFEPTDLLTLNPVGALGDTEAEVQIAYKV
jgi:hypothetical protein